MSFASRALALVRLGRPKFLLGGFALYGLGAAAASAQGHPLDWTTYLWGQGAVTAIQLTTHYSNDYFDYHADLANQTPTPWSGGSRVLVQQQLPSSAALVTALVFAVVALCCTTVVAFRTGLSSAILLVVMLLLAWSYSSPPLRLHSRGMGEPTVALVVPFFTPLSGYLLQAGTVEVLPLLLCLPLMCLQLVMLLVLEFPDERGDRLVGKQSWVVLFGARRVALLVGVLLVSAFALSFAAATIMPESVVWAWLVLAPLGASFLWRLIRGDWKRPSAWNQLAFFSVALFFLATSFDVVALTLSALGRGP